MVRYGYRHFLNLLQTVSKKEILYILGLNVDFNTWTPELGSMKFGTHA